MPGSVIDAMTDLLRRGVSNIGGSFEASTDAAAVVAAARRAVADLFNAAHPEEIVFGQNMTSLTFAVSRAIARTWNPGDEIVVTRLDHDANVWPWVVAAKACGVEVKYADFDPAAGCVLPVEAVASRISDRTRLVAVTHASNAVGTIVDVGAVADAAHAVGALCYVDAVHYTPHGPVDVEASGCDFLVASAYKFFGPHTGVMYGRHELLAELDAFKVRPSPDEPPDKWETGTQSFESLAGVTAAVDYLAGLGDGPDRRTALRSAMGLIRDYERSLSSRFLSGLAEIPGVSLYGLAEAEGRTPTFSLDIAGISPADAAQRLGREGIFTWSGDYYAVDVMRRLDKEGLLRIGFVHYSLAEEVDLIVDALDRMAGAYVGRLRAEG